MLSITVQVFSFPATPCCRTLYYYIINMIKRLREECHRLHNSFLQLMTRPDFPPCILRDQKPLYNIKLLRESDISSFSSSLSGGLLNTSHRFWNWLYQFPTLSCSIFCPATFQQTVAGKLGKNSRKMRKSSSLAHPRLRVMRVWLRHCKQMMFFLLLLCSNSQLSSCSQFIQASSIFQSLLVKMFRRNN